MLIHSFTSSFSQQTRWYYTGAKKINLIGFWPCWTPTVSATAATINEYVSVYLSCVCFYCFHYSYSLLTHVCLFPSSTVLYEQQQCWHVLYQYLCHHGVLLPSKYNRNTTASATTTGTRSDNGNFNCDMHTTPQYHQNADRQSQPRNRIVDQQATPLHRHDVPANEDMESTCRRCRDGKYMQAIQRGEGCVVDVDREWTWVCQLSW